MCRTFALAVFILLVAACTADLSPGSILVEVDGLAGHGGEHLAGVLVDEQRPPEGVAGFAVVVPNDHYTASIVMGHVKEEWGDGDELWPWPRGKAAVPPGEYLLILAVGTDYCCYSRWAPAASPGLKTCLLPVVVGAEPVTIRIENVRQAAEDHWCTGVTQS